MKKLILIDCDGVVLNWDDAFEWWVKRKYSIVKDPEVKEYTGGVYGRYNLTVSITGSYNWLDLVAEFNATDYCANLPPLRDAISKIRYLHEEHGYVFQVITSFSLHPYHQRRRVDNLRQYFGSAICGIDFADLCAEKRHLLEPYEGAKIPWVEDKLSNAVVGADLGLTPFLMMHQYNYKDALDMDKRVTPVANWADITKKLLNSLD